MRAPGFDEGSGVWLLRRGFRLRDLQFRVQGSGFSPAPKSAFCKPPPDVR